MSKLYYGDSEVLKWYEEEDQIMKAYYGDTLMFGEEGEEPTPIPNYLNFTARNGAATIGMYGSATPNVSYSFDGTNWTTWDYSNLTIPSGSTVYMKGNNPKGFSTSTSIRKTFAMSGTIEANGNIMSLLYDDNFEGQLTIPSNYCFNFLFSGCTSLTYAPELPATTLANYCYNYMFKGCTSLTNAPQLLATTLATYCYQFMFSGCTSLTYAPQLPATTLASSCYRGMFNGCANLNYIKMMATDISASSCLLSWVQGVAASGTFVKNSAATWTTTGNDGVPTGWTIEYASE